LDYHVLRVSCSRNVFYETQHGDLVVITREATPRIYRQMNFMQCRSIYQMLFALRTNTMLAWFMCTLSY